MKVSFWSSLSGVVFACAGAVALYFPGTTVGMACQVLVAVSGVFGHFAAPIVKPQ